MAKIHCKLLQSWQLMVLHCFCQGSVSSVKCPSWVLWHTPIMSCFYVSVRLRVCVPCFVLERGVRISALVSWISVSYWGSDIRAPCSCCVSVQFRVRLTSRSAVHVCSSLCFSLVACFYVVISCMNTWHISILISCLLVSCFAHGCDLFCWPCACVFVLCEHMVLS